jgi:hypothetical protein
VAHQGLGGANYIAIGSTDRNVLLSYNALRCLSSHYDLKNPPPPSVLSQSYQLTDDEVCTGLGAGQPSLQDLGGEVFVRAVEVKLLALRDMVDNPKCSDSTTGGIAALVSRDTARQCVGCSCAHAKRCGNGCVHHSDICGRSSLPSECGA